MDPARRPSFAKDFPSHEALDVLVDAFARGDFARVRADARQLAVDASDEDVRRAARTLYDRTRPDPLAVGLVAVTAVLLIALSAYWMVNGKPPPSETPAAHSALSQ